MSTLRNAMSGRIAVNALYLTISNLLQYALSFATGVLIARFLGADALGIYGLAASIGQIGSRIADLGMTTILTRMFSRSHPDAPSRFAMAIAFRLWTGIAMVVAVQLFGLALGYDLELQVALLLYSAGLIVSGVREIANTLYYGRESMARPALASAMFRVVAFTLTAVFIGAGLSVIWSIAALLIGQIVASWYLHTGEMAEARRLHVTFTWVGIGGLLRESYPVAVAGIFAMVNLRADTVLLSRHVSHAEIGIYSGAFAVIIGLTVVPSSLLPAIYPALSREFHRNPRGAVTMLLRSQLLGALLGLGAALVLWLTAGWVMRVLYGPELVAGGPVLATLALSVPLIYLSYTNSMFFNGVDRQDLNLWTAIIAGVVNVVANLILIPRHGITGAAWATVLSEATFLVTTSFLVTRLTHEIGRRP